MVPSETTHARFVHVWAVDDPRERRAVASRYRPVGTFDEPTDGPRTGPLEGVGQ